MNIKEALKAAVDHIEHMAAWINSNYHVGTYSFESLGEDMPGIKAALARLESADARPLDFFSENVDSWGPSEWFNRLANAVRGQDAAVIAGDEITMEICRNVAASSAMRLVRDYEQIVRKSLATGLVPDEAAPSQRTILSSDCIDPDIEAAIRADEREKCADMCRAAADIAEDEMGFRMASDLESAIRAGRAEG